MTGVIPQQFGPVGVTGPMAQKSTQETKEPLELGIEFLSKLEQGAIPLPALHCFASMAVSLKRIADALNNGMLQGPQGPAGRDGLSVQQSGIPMDKIAIQNLLEGALKGMRGY